MGVSNVIGTVGSLKFCEKEFKSSHTEQNKSDSPLCLGFECFAVQVGLADGSRHLYPGRYVLLRAAQATPCVLLIKGLLDLLKSG